MFTGRISVRPETFQKKFDESVYNIQDIRFTPKHGRVPLKFLDMYTAEIDLQEVAATPAT